MQNLFLSRIKRILLHRAGNAGRGEKRRKIKAFAENAKETHLKKNRLKATQTKSFTAVLRKKHETQQEVNYETAKTRKP